MTRTAFWFARSVSGQCGLLYRATLYQAINHTKTTWTELMATHNRTTMHITKRTNRAVFRLQSKPQRWKYARQPQNAMRPHEKSDRPTRIYTCGLVCDFHFCYTSQLIINNEFTLQRVTCVCWCLVRGLLMHSTHDTYHGGFCELCFMGFCCALRGFGCLQALQYFVVLRLIV